MSPASCPVTKQESDDYSDPPLTPLQLIGRNPLSKHRILTEELAEELRHHVPSILQISHTWELLYSIEQCGTSLQTLYNNCRPNTNENLNRRRGFFIVVEDTRGNIFGAYINEHLRPLDGRYYYGNGDCFLWKVEKGKIKNLDNDTKSDKHTLNLRVYHYTSMNDFVIYSNNQFFSIGSGGGKFGLWIDSNLQIGASDPVDTFGNDKLSDHSKFNILGLEIWKIK
ncbi:hypothetical protein CANINC_004810 [Pichia inconspicua]|uniref:Oxidation resistance protein 1 n=1 Tax=Pichia inconspicua TaxID=52247 RepID=A0A4T0WV68_9ASCO|nr:hypothetical protein CANINC_004810 [[Candida] inconspicua]